MKDMLKDYYRSLNVDEKVFEYCNSVEEKLKDRFAAIDAVSELNQLKVLKAMQDNRLSEAHFAGSSVMVIRMTEEMPLRGYMQTYFTRRMPLSGHR